MNSPERKNKGFFYGRNTKVREREKKKFIENANDTRDATQVDRTSARSRIFNRRQFSHAPATDRRKNSRVRKKTHPITLTNSEQEITN